MSFNRPRLEYSCAGLAGASVTAAGAAGGNDAGTPPTGGNAVWPAPGAATTGAGTDTLTRSVRGAGLGIGVQSGDVFEVGVRLVITDAS